jgi:hypothetical protein
MSNLHPIKIIRINLKEQIQQNKESKRKKNRIEKNKDQVWDKKKIKLNYEGWNWKIISIKKNK